MIKKTYFIILISFFLANCATKIPVELSDKTIDDYYKLFVSPKDHARVYYTGGDGKHLIGNNPHGIPNHFLINNYNIATLNKDNYVVVNLAPGEYSVSWDKAMADVRYKIVPMKLNLRAGDVIFLQGDINLRSASAGLLGLAFVPPEATIRNILPNVFLDKSLINLTDCPIEFCFSSEKIIN